MKQAASDLQSAIVVVKHSDFNSDGHAALLGDG
jgi:hypothetical protein